MISSTGEVIVWHSARHPWWTTLHCSLVTKTVMVMIVRTTTTTMMVIILRTATMMMMVIAMWRWQTSAHFVTKNGTSFLSFNCNSFEPLSKIVPPPPQFLFFTHFLPFSPRFPFFTPVSLFHHSLPFSPPFNQIWMSEPQLTERRFQRVPKSKESISLPENPKARPIQHHWECFFFKKNLSNSCAIFYKAAAHSQNNF